jgi:hypothetical protein
MQFDEEEELDDGSHSGSIGKEGAKSNDSDDDDEEATLGPDDYK